MALPDLATTADLSARGFPHWQYVATATMLSVASSLVRGAAGSPILETDSTVGLTGWGDTLLNLPGLPVSAVDSVKIDGVAVTDWKLVDSSKLWLSTCWGDGCTPVDVEVTMTHGIPEVPAHVVQLVCDLAIAGINAASDGAHDPRVIAERIDDYSVQFASEAVATAVELPKLTKRWLRAQFGGGAAVVEYR